MAALQQYLERLYNLNVGVLGQGAGRHERPHKPVMLLTVIELIESGYIRENRIEWSEDLKNIFSGIFDKVRAANDKLTPENPFFYLRSDEFWRHVAATGQEDLVKGLKSPPSIGDLKDGLFHVELEPELFSLLNDPKSRDILRNALISRYFPQARSELLQREEESPAEENASAEQGRSTAFRRLILETYDYQCVACGIRMWLPNDTTMVDAAHLIPFSVSRNDHPTNGFALCKNHHWAFDRHLITPTEEGVWGEWHGLKRLRGSGSGAGFPEIQPWVW